MVASWMSNPSAKSLHIAGVSPVLDCALSTGTWRDMYGIHHLFEWRSVSGLRVHSWLSHLRGMGRTCW